MSSGRWLFRFRSLTPVPVILLGLAWCWRDAIAPGPGGETVDAALNALGITVSALGGLVRFVTAGLAPHGSQRKTVSARVLCTTGPYALVRHPLYVGNALIVGGLLLVVHRAQAYALVGVFFAIAWGLIINTEERHLHERFGDEWVRWAKEVPMLWPRLGVRGAFAGPFSWRLAVRREMNPFVAWGVGVQLLLLWEWWARARLTDARARLLEAGIGVLLVLLAGNKLWKRVSP